MSPVQSAVGLVMLLGLASLAQAKAPSAVVGCDAPQAGTVGPLLGNVLVQARPVKIYRVGEPVFGLPGESMHDFSLRVANVFRQFTDTTQKESCATICKSVEGPPVFGVLPTTTLSAGACLVTQACPDGMVPTDETIHTHGKATHFKVCDTDRMILGWLFRKGEVVAKEKADEFSPEDFAGGRGYLVSPGAVWHQAGPRHVEKLQSALTAALDAAPTRTAYNDAIPALSRPGDPAGR